MAVSDINASQQVVNLLRNGGMESWPEGATSPEYWTLGGSGATAVEDTSNFHLGSASAKLTRAGANASLTQNVVGQTLPIAYAQGKAFTLAARLKKESGRTGRITLDDGATVTVSGFGCQTETWQLITITHTVSEDGTKLDCVLEVYDTDGSVWFDSVQLVEGIAVPAFQPNPADVQDPTNADQTAPSTPTGLAATSGVLTVMLTWSRNPESDVTQYHLQRADDSLFTTNLKSHTIAATVFTDTPNDTVARYYRVRAVRTSGAVSAWSSTVSEAADPVPSETYTPDSTPPAVPAQPTLASGTILTDDGQVLVYLDVAWAANADVDLAYYQVDYRRQGDSYWTTRTVTKDHTTIREIGVVGGVAYEARVAAIDTSNNFSGFSTTGTATAAADTTAPDAPTLVTASSGFQQLTLQWTPPAIADFDVVEVWRSTTNDSATAVKVGEHPGILWTDTNLANATTYYYWLKSRDTSGNLSAFHAGPTSGTTATTRTIGGSDVVTTSALITSAAQIQDAVITSAKISYLTADKLAAATIQVLLKLGLTNIELDGVNGVITVKDAQGSPVTRVKLGKTGTGSTDYGLQIYNADGALMWDLSGGAQTAGIAGDAIVTAKVLANAITSGAIYSRDTPLTLNDGMTEVASVSITANGNEVFVIGKYWVNNTDAIVSDPHLHKTNSSGTLLDQIPLSTPIIHMGRDASPGTGTVTYKMYINKSTGTCTVDNVRLYAVNLKK